MRSFVLILATTAALLCAFAAYVRLGAPAGGGAAGMVAPPAPAPPPLNQLYAEGAWSNLYDIDGQLFGRLRSRLCVPRSDGLWHLTDPEAEFYQHDGQIAHMTATEGDVRLGQQTHNETLGNGPVDPPSQGTLRNVTVKLYASQAQRDRDDPDMTLRMGNTRFDADTNRLYTVAETDAAGQTVEADRIPITVNGRQMDFTGSGLVMDWNAQLHELKSLVVAHGERLRLNQEASTSSKTSGNGGGGVSTASNPKQQPPVHVYLATFDGGVRVMQGGQERISSPQMVVTVATGMRSSQSTAADHQRAAQPSNSAAEKPPEPVDVFWGSTVTVVPASGVKLRSGESIIRFPGPLVHVREDGMDMTAGDVQYDTADASGTADGAADQPLRMTFLNRDGTESGRAVTGRAQYWQNGQRVSLIGGGAGQFTDENKPTDLMRAGWSQACNLTLAGTGDHLEIHNAELVGDAQVLDGPKDGPENLRLTAQRINTEFIPAAAQPTNSKSNKSPRQTAEGKASAPELRRLIATTDAYCKIHDARQPDRTLAGDTLTVEMADDSAGKPYPHFISAVGGVHAEQDQQELWSHRLDATVLPAPAAASSGRARTDQSRYELQTLVADGDVRVRGKNGDTATGDTLTIDEHDNQPWITLIGNPMAVVSGDNRTLKGPRIEMRPHDNWALVAGPGTIEGLESSAPGKPAQPIHARWNTSAEIDGAKNQINILGGIEADTTEKSGVKNTALADQAIMYLTPKPTTRPAKTSAKEKPPGTEQPFDALRDKQIQVVSLLGHASVESTLLAADNSIARRAFIEGDRIESDLPSKRLVVPGPGRMLLEEHPHRASASPAAAAADTTADKSPAGGQGATAFAWTKQFTYDESANQAVLDGSVNMRHLPDSPHASPTSMVADKVIADFTLPAAPATPSATGDEQPKLSHLHAQGHILVRSETKLIQAMSVDYDPITQVLTIDGTPIEPVVITDAKSGGEETCEQAWINLATNEFKALNVNGHARH